MKKQGPREGLIRRGPGEHDIPDMGPDVEGHAINTNLRRPIEAGIPGVPGSDGIVGVPHGGGELTEDTEEDRTRRR